MATFPRDVIHEELSDAHRKLWEALGLLEAAGIELNGSLHPATMNHINASLEMLRALIDDGMAPALRTYASETPE